MTVAESPVTESPESSGEVEKLNSSKSGMTKSVLSPTKRCACAVIVLGRQSIANRANSEVSTWRSIVILCFQFVE